MKDRPLEEWDGNDLIDRRNWLLDILCDAIRNHECGYAGKSEFPMEFEEVVRELTIREEC